MTDFAAARRMMVDGQVRPGDVTDLRIIAAMLEIPRERFVPDRAAALAYLDADVPVAGNASGTRRLLKPMVLARLVQAAQVGADDRVLVVGCATGYSAALMARLAREVVALEEDAELASLAAANLQAVANIALQRGPLTQGWPPLAPYDVILLDGAAEAMPEVLCRQLREGGRLVAVVRRGRTGQAMLYRAAGGDVSGWPFLDATASVLPGFAAVPSFVF
jgi:protein-L-isoaspartate(D-aspartate) O-methyltransferase